MSAGVLAVSGWAVGLVGLLAAGVVVRVLGCERESVARAAHEVRGPLTAIGLGLELEARELGPGSAAYGALSLEVARAGLALEDLTRARRRRAHVGRLERVDVPRLVTECVAGACPLAEAAGVALSAEDLGDRVVIWGDRVRLAQAVGNLIANAIEHGGGEVGVRLRVGAASVRIEVSDAGPGLPAPVADLTRHPRGGRGSRGRGLAIAAAIAERHRGRVAAAPSEGGARVVLELPRAAVRERTERPTTGA